MLPAYIIEEILERQRERERRGEVCVEPPPPDRPVERSGEDGIGDEEEDRGIAIVDFSI